MKLLRLLATSAVLGTSAFAQRYDAVQRLTPEQDVGIDQKLGEKIPLELAFRAEDGREVRLRELFGARPVVLSLVYYECPMLCSLVLNDQVRALRALSLELGDDFDLLTVSIDPRETSELARAKKEHYLASYDDNASEAQRAAWHFLTGEEAAIAELARAVGFRYAFDEQSGEYAHAAGLMVLTPDGTLSRYVYGLGYQPRDLKLAIIDASGGKVGSLVDQILIRCFHYDPATGQYYFAIMAALRVAAAATVLVLVGFVLRSVLRERRRRAAEVPA